MSDIKKMYSTLLGDSFPTEMTISLGGQTLIYRKRTWKIANNQGELEERGLRYGENPDQEAALYELINGNLILGGCAFINPGNGLVSALSENDMLQAGKHPGKINLTDVDNGLNIIKYFTANPAAVILKHNNPCGAALGVNLAEAYNRANQADRIAAFGGAVVCNRALDKDTAELMAANYLEVVCAPEYEEGALAILARRKNLRILQMQAIERLADFETKRFLDFKSLIDGGIIVQQSAINSVRSAADLLPALASDKSGNKYSCVRQPTQREIDDMIFGWAVEHGVSSNSVLFVKDGCTVAIGAGEQDRVGVAAIAVHKAYRNYADALCFTRFGLAYVDMRVQVQNGERDVADLEGIDAEVKMQKAGLRGSVMISDAFFPFRDAADVGIAQDVSAILQTGGSIRDFESIQACNEAKPPVAMMYTGKRSFKH